ncbi:hypothetical protein P7K49_019827 [Saguinus oedipus]|uniref:Uncharacterized protein n=1 Tax=Saguinus oedipus TaxID=9490 RepID=A0ABQ9UZ66_SAGOE|nr:hypothetical protein P7K49_019827 [Saguinus oedipus]
MTEPQFQTTVETRPDEEAVVDQGGTSTILNIHYEKEELEDQLSNWQQEYLLQMTSSVLYACSTLLKKKAAYDDSLTST